MGFFESLIGQGSGVSQEGPGLALEKGLAFGGGRVRVGTIASLRVG